MPEEKNNIFHLGITMAGAVSAGCYTAGVLDYLFEVLDLWERAKEGKVEGIDNSMVPNHQVIIDAMGGTSAGGMATAITALYTLKGEIKPVKDIPANPMESQNLLYDSWIHLDDGEEKSFKKIWDIDDLEDGVVSLFNSKVIDAIAIKALDSFEKEKDFPTYLENHLPKFISKELEVLISHTLLRGIPLAVDFKPEIARRYKDSPTHNTYEHYMVSHYKLNGGSPVNEDAYLWFNPFVEKCSNQIKLSSIATGAFPIGLAYRKFDQNQFSDNYLKTVIKRIIYGNFGKENPDEDDQIKLKNFEEQFNSLTVDGGAINNEPFKEVGSILEDRFYQKDKPHQNYGLIMIDPFPDNEDSKEPYKEPQDLLRVAPAIIQTLWNQSKVKRKEMLDKNYFGAFKGVIYPKKYINDRFKSEKYPMLSASFSAFGGFLDVRFRVHDFFLGRNNARNFIQRFASFPYEPDQGNVHPIHKDWTDTMVQKFLIIRKENGVERLFLPIIPDLNLILENKKSGDDKLKYTYKERPIYNPEELLQLKDNIETRFKKVLEKSIKSIENFDKGQTDEYPIARKWMNSNKKKRNWFQRIKDGLKNRVAKKGKKMGTKRMAKFLTNAVIKMILNDLDKMKILKDKID